MTSILPALRRGGAIAALSLGASVAASAQTVPYDPNCKPIEQTEAQAMVDETCSSHAGCRFFVMAPINATCKTVNFFRNLGKAVLPSGEIRNEDVIEAATDDFPSKSTGQRIIDNAKNAASKASAAIGKLVRTSDGQIVYEETVDTGGGQKAGSIIASSGQMARGTFDSSYRLQGSGQLIAADGTMRAGEFRNNQLNGEGIVAERDGNRTVLIEGTFDGDTPVGEVIRNYADGSRVRELWENGKMVARGDRAPKGKVPPPIRRPEVKLANADVKHGLYQVEGPNGTKRWELWCKDQLADQGRWYPKGHYPQKPERQSCDNKIEQAGTDESEFSTGDVIERTLGPGTLRPTGRIINPLVVQGPPWICSGEIDAFMAAWGRRTGGRGMRSAAQYWEQFRFNAIAALAYASSSPVRELYRQYEASSPNLASQPVAYRDDYGQQYREGYFRSRAAMRQLAETFDSAARYDTPGSEGATAMGIGACVARYLEANARD